jgi:hypothetical protein
MGFEPHSVAGSALKLASQLPLRGPAPFGIPCRGSQMQIGLTPHVSRLGLERAMGFEPTTTSLGS